MSGTLAYWGLWLFFSLVFGVFYSLAYSILMGIRDNYYRYAQKARLQWTGPSQGQKKHSLALWKIGVASVATAWLVVHFIIFD